MTNDNVGKKFMFKDTHFETVDEWLEYIAEWIIEQKIELPILQNYTEKGFANYGWKMCKKTLKFIFLQLHDYQEISKK